MTAPRGTTELLGVELRAFAEALRAEDVDDETVDRVMKRLIWGSAEGARARAMARSRNPLWPFTP